MKRYTVIDTDCEADVWYDNVENKVLNYKDIEQILEIQDNKWYKLKEWLKEVSKTLDKTYGYIVNHENGVFIDEWYKGMVAKEILEKMQELEGEDE